MLKRDFDTIVILALIVLVVVLLVLSPLITIWALNTLFPALAIPYTIWTWLAALWLVGAPVAAKFRAK